MLVVDDCVPVSSCSHFVSDHLLVDTGLGIRLEIKILEIVLVFSIFLAAWRTPCPSILTSSVHD